MAVLGYGITRGLVEDIRIKDADIFNMLSWIAQRTPCSRTGYPGLVFHENSKTARVECNNLSIIYSGSRENPIINIVLIAK